MLKVRKRYETIEHSFVSLDIENDPSGKMIWVCLYDGEKFHHFQDWESVLQHIGSKLGHDKRYSTVYAHNGGGWDWLSLIDHLLSSSDEIIDCVMSGSRMIMARVKLGIHTVSLVDSFTLFWAKLDEVGRKLLNIGKIDTANVLPHTLLRRDKKTFLAYVERDTKLCYDSVVKFGEILHNKVAPIQSLGVTLASTAMKVFTTGYMETAINTPDSKYLKGILREGYSGGRVQCLKAGHFNNVWVYDINSLYPYVMSTTEVPVSAKGYFTKRWVPGSVGCFRVKFSGKYPIPVFMQRGEAVKSGEGVFYSPEIQRHIDCGGTIEVIEGYVFTETKLLFGEYVRILYEMRKQNKGTVLDWAAKLLLNSLYGKFGMKSEREAIVRIAPSQLSQYIKSGKVRPIDEERDIYAVSTEVDAPYIHVGIAAMITSAARVQLHKAMDFNTVYVDTDSIHSTVQRGDLEIGTELGQFKIEAEGEGVYLGKKLYGVRGTETKIRLKGVKLKRKVDDDNGADVRFDDLLAILKGTTKQFKYRTPATVREVLQKGYQSCKFYPRKRAIRKTK